jgi:tRNA-dependent cyclodipeptide synthase
MKANRSVVNQVKDFLDHKAIPYIHTAYSDAYSAEKTQRIKDELGKEHIESVLIEVIQPDNRVEIAMIIVPATRKINLDSLQKTLGNKRISFVGKQTKELFPNYELGTLPPFAGFYSPPIMQIYLTQEVLQLQEIALYIESYNDCFRMALEDFLLSVQPVENIIVATTAKYRIEVTQVFPEVKRNMLQNHNHCILGFSLQNSNFIPAKLAGMTEWISRNFSECTVIIGDSIHRITLEINGTPRQYSLNKALKIGRDVIDDSAAIFNRHEDKCKFNFALCSELQKDDSYESYHNSLINLFQQNEDFQNSVHGFSDMFLGKHSSQHNPELSNYHRELSVSYLLEESACLAILVKRGIYPFVYPGALTVIQKLCQGQFHEAPEEFKNMISVSLHPKKRH